MTPPTPRRPFNPPLLLLTAIVAMTSLHSVFPFARLIDGPWRFLGLMPALIGLGLNIWGSRLFEKRQTTIKPTGHSSTLVLEGAFLYTRNPMYLGMTLILIGIALGLGTLSPWLVIPIFVLGIQERFIKMEERKMESEFGAEYNAYKQKVRRWL